MARRKIEAAEMLSSVADAKGNVSINTLLKELFHAFGGAKGFVREVKLDFDSCAPGHANRVRIESDIMHTLAKSGTDKDDLPTDMETLEALAKQHMADLSETDEE